MSMEGFTDNAKTEYEQRAQDLAKLDSELQEAMKQRQRLEVQLCENTLVKSELELVHENSIVYKLTGPALIKQPSSEAKNTVDKRIEFIQAELEKVREKIADIHSKVASIQEKLQALRGSQPANKLAMA